MADGKFSIIKLNNENYFVWKYRVEMLLIKEGLWNAVNEPKPEPVTTVWTDMNNKARAYISLLVSDNQLNHVRNAATALEAWTNLKNYHEKASLSNKVRLMREICSLKLAEGGDADVHVNMMTELFEKLAALGENLSDNWRVAMLLSSLPHSYDTLITALETRPENDLTLSMVQSKLVEEGRKRSSTHSEVEMALKSTHIQSHQAYSSMECYFCKETGHAKRDCKRYKEWLQKRNSTDTAQGSSERVNMAVRKDDFAF